MWTILLSLFGRLLPLLGRLPLVARFLPFLKGWRLVAVSVAAGAAIGLWLYVDHLRDENAGLRETKATLAAYLNEAQKANAQNQNTIRILQGANEELGAAVTVSEEEVRRLAEEAAERELRTRARLDDTLSELENLRNATTSCQELSRVDIGAVCPAVVERMREHAAEASGRNRDR